MTDINFLLEIRGCNGGFRTMTQRLEKKGQVQIAIAWIQSGHLIEGQCSSNFTCRRPCSQRQRVFPTCFLGKQRAKETRLHHFLRQYQSFIQLLFGNALLSLQAGFLTIKEFC